MKVIVDTSVWSYALRHKGKMDKHPSLEILKDLIDGDDDIRILGVILQEILSGVKKQEDFERLRDYFLDIPLVEPGRMDYEDAARMRNELLGKGIQTTTIDALIAACSIRNGFCLLTADKDFFHMAKYVDLKLLYSEG